MCGALELTVGWLCLIGSWWGDNLVVMRQTHLRLQHSDYGHTSSDGVLLEPSHLWWQWWENILHVRCDYDFKSYILCDGLIWTYDNVFGLLLLVARPITSRWEKNIGKNYTYTYSSIEWQIHRLYQSRAGRYSPVGVLISCLWNRAHSALFLLMKK